MTHWKDIEEPQPSHEETDVEVCTGPIGKHSRGRWDVNNTERKPELMDHPVIRVGDRFQHRTAGFVEVVDLDFRDKKVKITYEAVGDKAHVEKTTFSDMNLAVKVTRRDETPKHKAWRIEVEVRKEMEEAAKKKPDLETTRKRIIDELKTTRLRSMEDVVRRRLDEHEQDAVLGRIGVGHDVDDLILWLRCRIDKERCDMLTTLTEGSLSQSHVGRRTARIVSDHGEAVRWLDRLEKAMKEIERGSRE